MTDDDQAPHWSNWREIPRCWLDRRNLFQSGAVAVVVGTILTAINQGDVVLSGRITLATLIRIGLTYLVPFLVSSYGILVGRYRPAS